MSIELSVKSLGGIIYLEVETDTTILDIKQMIHEREPIFSVRRIKLYDMVRKNLVELQNHREAGSFRWRDGHELVLLQDMTYCALTTQKIYELEERHRTELVQNQNVNDIFGLSAGAVYHIPLRTVNEMDYPLHTNYQAAINAFSSNKLILNEKNYQRREFTITNGMTFKGTFEKIICFVTTIRTNEGKSILFYSITLKFLPPFSLTIDTEPTPYQRIFIEKIASKNMENVKFNYVNVMPCE